MAQACDVLIENDRGHVANGKAMPEGGRK